MSQFPQTVTDFWQAQFPRESTLCQNDQLTVTTNPSLEDARRLQILDMVNGPAQVVMTPSLAASLDLDGQNTATSATELRQRLDKANVKLHEADNLLYFTAAEAKTLCEEQAPEGVRQLTAADGAAFSEFTASASEQDLDDAYVELDHWVVFGAFDAGKLVCAASMYPWQRSQIADMGVLTLEGARGKGHGRRVIRALCQYAYSQGYEPQYRCHLDNLGSVGLAKAAGLVKFGTWEALSSDGTE